MGPFCRYHGQIITDDADPLLSDTYGGIIIQFLECGGEKSSVEQNHLCVKETIFFINLAYSCK